LEEKTVFKSGFKSGAMAAVCAVRGREHKLSSPSIFACPKPEGLMHNTLENNALENIHDHCGVFGMFLKRGIANSSISKNLFNGLISLQHRGQESAGFSYIEDEKIHTVKGMGLVTRVLNKRAVRSLDESKSNVVIGHVRYSTSGSSSLKNAHPFYLSIHKTKLALAFNGNVKNIDLIREELRMDLDREFISNSDTEVMACLFYRELKSERGDIFKAMKRVMLRLDGAYSLTILMDDGRLIAARDPLGFRPLCIGKNEYGYYVASETCALNACHARFIRDIKPGEVVVFSKDGMKSKQVVNAKSHAHCFFEYTYFADVTSKIEGISIYEARKRMGEILAKKIQKGYNIVIPVPDSGRTAAISFAAASGIEYREGLVKNRYIHRTFIMPSQIQRSESVRLKHRVLKETIEGVNIAVIDDSIVRGTTTKKIIMALKGAGAKKVAFFSTTAPIIAPCFYGIDIPTEKELIANQMRIEQIAKFIGADILTYMAIDDLKKAIGLKKNDLCIACLTGKYPKLELGNK